MLHSLSSGHFHLIEDMIIGTADQDTCLFHSDVFYQLKVFLVGTDPARDLREFIAPLHTFDDGISILLAVQEKFGLADLAFGATQFMQIIKNRYDLFGAVGSTGLLPVTEGRIRDPDFLRHVMRNHAVIECDLGNLTVRKQVPENVGGLYIHEGIHVLFQLEKICLVVHCHTTVFHLSITPMHLLFVSFCIIVYNYTCIVKHISK